jgi:hypothetical protein
VLEVAVDRLYIADSTKLLASLRHHHRPDGQVAGVQERRAFKVLRDDDLLGRKFHAERRLQIKSDETQSVQIAQTTKSQTVVAVNRASVLIQKFACRIA